MVFPIPKSKVVSPIHPDTWVEFNELDEESDEEGFPRTTQETKNIAEKILYEISQYSPGYYIVCPDDNGNISITARENGNSVLILCKPGGEVSCVVVHTSKGDNIYPPRKIKKGGAWEQLMTAVKSEISDMSNEAK